MVEERRRLPALAPSGLPGCVCVPFPVYRIQSAAAACADGGIPVLSYFFFQAPTTAPMSIMPMSQKPALMEKMA